VSETKVAKVEVKSAWLSKINWTQAVAVVAMVATMFGLDIDATLQAEILAAIIGVQSVVTWVIKTFFSPTVTPASVEVKSKL
jgi:hypothetical protein